MLRSRNHILFRFIYRSDVSMFNVRNNRLDNFKQISVFYVLLYLTYAALNYNM